MSYDPNNILNIAKGFLLAAKRCFEQRQLQMGQIQAPIVPGVVCTTFSIELSLKAVLIIESKIVKGHELDELYKKLSPDSKLVLQKKLSLSQSDLQNKLAEVSKVFEKWRYIYESETTKLDIDFLKKLAVVANDLAETKINKS